MTSRRPSLALVVAVLALVLAASTTSYAAGLARNSVGTKHLRNNAVVAAKIKNGAVTAPKVANNAIAGPKVQDGAVTGPKIKDGSVGRADLAPGVARPVTTDVLRTLTPGTDVPIASAGGLTYHGVCVAVGPSTTVGQVRIEPTAATAPSASISGSYLVTVNDAGGIFSDASGAAPFTDYVLQAGGTTSTQGKAGLTGTLQYLQQPAARVDVGITAVGGANRSCTLRVVVTPA